MKTFALATTAAIVSAATLTPVQGWWDNGHMLVGEVAAQLMAKEDVATIEKVLSDWDKDFPGTSTISTAATWADQVKCSKDAPNCPTKPSLNAFDDWHYINLPMYANGARWGNGEPDMTLFKQAFAGLAPTVLESLLKTMSTTQSVWSANLALRQIIHIIGDSHQPMHAVGAVSESFPQGDLGGNLYKFQSPCPFSNLHALYDSVAGEYTTNWNPDASKYRPGVEKNATELVGWLPLVKDNINIQQWEKLSYGDFVKASLGADAYKKVLLESYEIATTFIYPSLNLEVNAAGFVACPSKEYAQWAATVSKFRVALGGKRLAAVLTQLAKQLRTLKLA
ncbi:hypothetical protein P43SY_002586 [Pythium insidiosum]|uniref:S1/P1 nuclease n=1 Tax=Pythium insidiosum TaxID=114742 RepID=A0AAD5LTQ2_PYTIN|nr:hypothetical protein P43SY_002586 [Pythium insidiosum]KAJ0412718.1 hypothetical protein ATCC90586_002348 [Pythium insidiosum]